MENEFFNNHFAYIFYDFLKMFRNMHLNQTLSPSKNHKKYKQNYF